jgi:membrane protein YdbS with pleckstrin-like domain
VGIGIIWFVLRPLVIWATATYTFTNRRLITRSGVIIRRGHDMPLARISDIAYEFGPIDRLLGCGTLLISDASTHGTIKLHDIPRVEETQRRINALLQEIHDPAAGHD